MSTLSPLQVEEIFWDRLFHQCISHESNAWRKRCVFRPDLKAGKEQGARRWSGNLFQSLGAAALKEAAAEDEVTVWPVNKFADKERRLLFNAKTFLLDRVYFNTKHSFQYGSITIKWERKLCNKYVVYILHLQVYILRGRGIFANCIHYTYAIKQSAVLFCVF